MKYLLTSLILTLSITNFNLLAKEVSYGNNTIVLSETIKPGDDFNQYVNQNWIHHTKIPAGYPFRNAFVDVHLRTQSQLKSIISQLIVTDSSELTLEEHNIIKLYESYLDTHSIDNLGLEPIKKTLINIETISTKNEVAAFMAKSNVGSFVDLLVSQDEKEPTINRLHMTQGGLTMPRAFYLEEGEEMDVVRNSYASYITTIFQHLGYQDALERALKVFALETRLAQGYWSITEMRDVVKTYSPVTKKELAALAPEFPWEVFLEELGVKSSENEKIIVMADTALQHLSQVFDESDLDVLRAYLEFHYVDSYARFLPSFFAEAHFKFHSGVLAGVKVDKTREENALRLVDELYGEELGKLYVKQYFSTKNKSAMLRLIEHLQLAFKKRFNENLWMDDATKLEAIGKMSDFTVKVGFPDHWHKNKTALFSKDTLIRNVEQIRQLNIQKQIQKIGQPVISWEWDILPQTVNAYYTPTANEIVFPAAILQPPFYSNDVDMAFNFGAIGAVIGHEIGHGFDDQGRMFDGKGIMRDWWTRSASQKYQVKTTQLVEQYNNYVFDGLSINGRLTLGENIGDLGGLTVSLEAYKQYCLESYPNGKAPIINGTTGIQRFFIAWAQVWREKATTEAIRSRILSDPHAPNQFRVNGIVRNIDDWYTAFNIDEKSKLYLKPEERVKIW
ncbi:M13 family metallopeptidase [Vibrio sp. Isolate34]|uniref:M13 family metallopeptidase n=1 Tax=Vibrio sp. Isolate34 TaxID=2908540 RepID=UPI001EFE5DBB|nr:M13 family metallopeptidase [Vibrio sp. Isolate34]MCG9638396.1 M13 family metallopeptidase [Vibrio sp. Isolate34]